MNIFNKPKFCCNSSSKLGYCCKVNATNANYHILLKKLNILHSKCKIEIS